MFEEIIRKYKLEGTNIDFYTAMAAPKDTDFSRWLTREYLTKVNDAYPGLAAEPFEALCQAAEALAAEKELCALACYARALLFESGFSVDYLVHIGFPRPNTDNALLNDFFGLLVHLSGIDVVEQRYASRGIPPEIMRASYQSVRIWVDSFHTFYGRWGHDRQCPRMVFIENFRFIRIGRLEFEMDRFYGKVVILRSRITGKTAALSEGDVIFDRDGLVSNTNSHWDPLCRRTFFAETEDCFCGHPIVNCRISSTVETFSKSEWYPVIRRGENAVNVHIPRDGRLDTESARQALHMAKDFFAKYFPQWKFDVFQCHSWLLDDQYHTMLGEDSNIVRFQKLFTLFPEESNDSGALSSIFSEAPFDLQSWTPISSMQRKVQTLYRDGGILRAGAGYILREQV